MWAAVETQIRPTAVMQRDLSWEKEINFKKENKH